MAAVVLDALVKTFEKGKRTALDRVTAQLPEGKISGVVGPDGAGKTTLLRIIAGLMRVDGGSCRAMEGFLGYLPQKFGLYEDLTVGQNLALYASLQEVSQGDPHFKRLLEFSGLGPFQKRLVGNLSGGMKQKLALMTALLRKPQLLLLDEPTLGVDPISQRELWKMIIELNAQGMTIITATSYLEEAEKCHYVLLLNEGRLLFSGVPEQFETLVEGRTYYFTGVGKMKRTLLDRLIGLNGIIDTIAEGEKIRVTFDRSDPVSDPAAYGLDAGAALVPRKATFEDAFIAHLGGVPKRPALKLLPIGEQIDHTVEARGLTRYFGTFKAVDAISFTIKRGEIFGLLGPNGAGKSTTFKMLCGLLRPSEGEALVGGVSLREAPSRARGLIGYMAQKFSLYDNMSVLQNLNFFAGIYPVKNVKRAVEEMVTVFDLKQHSNDLTGELPLGYKQRLALSCALMHQPQVLFLDEPTSGVDPLTRREFWHQINLLAASGVTILVSTHLMDEAEFCDRIGLINQGRLRMIETPDTLKKMVPATFAKAPTLADAFLYFCEVQ